MTFTSEDSEWQLSIEDDDALNLIRALHVADEAEVLAMLVSSAGIDAGQRMRIQERAVKLIDTMRASGKPGLMETFLAEYGLSTNEGIALMCLAEALLRVPDAGTIDDLIEDKIAPHDWQSHFGHSASSVVNASTVALMLTGRVLDEDNTASVSGLLNRTVKRLGEPVVRVAVKQAMREMGNQFVLGQSIEEALKRGRAEMKRGFLYSYDMLGEAALTQADADAYFESYAHAIQKIGASSSEGSIKDQPGISVKLSALHPRFELAKAERLDKELVPRLNALARLAKENNLGLNVDAEEANRLEILLMVVQKALSDPKLAGWDGFGLVIQAYGKRAAAVIDWFYEVATNLDRRVMVRLVKGAYWDSEIKQAQVDGAEDYPVFTRRVATDISYTCCAAKLLRMSDRIYPQFATHNAQTAAAILELAGPEQAYEFQRLHGMGESLHNHLLEDEGTRCRIYAPVGPHKDLLAYLVRRLLENGANSSFVNQVVDPRYSSTALAADPFEQMAEIEQGLSKNIQPSADLYRPNRQASKGWDLLNSNVVREVNMAREPYAEYADWTAEPILVDDAVSETSREIHNPANASEVVGRVHEATEQDCLNAAQAATVWEHSGNLERAFVLRRAAELYETNFGELFALLSREGGKTPVDAVAELREAVDFLRYYANQAEEESAGDPRGIITCISPWNFPLAIFTGQIAAALAAGNGVLAKPAETTPLIAAAAVRLMHAAGIPRSTLQLLPGDGSVGNALVQQPAVSGVCFTGSTTTAQKINRVMAEHLLPSAPLIAETGGLNAAIIDSTALPEQAVRDTLVSAFQSAGQRCSALRILYLQADIADAFLDMLKGAMDELDIGQPWRLDTDVGPIISSEASQAIQGYVDKAKAEGRLLKQLPAPDGGHFVGPAVIEVTGINELESEVFGPVLHVARFAAEDFDKVLADVNQRGFGLTFGLHTRIDERAKTISDRLKVGNIYVNRNQVGAIVESQPFGGEGLSGTGPKAGGPHYVHRFYLPDAIQNEPVVGPEVSHQQVQNEIDELHWQPEALSQEDMPCVTGESNTLNLWPKGPVLCLGPTVEDALAQAGAARRMGCPALTVVPGATGANAIDGYLKREVLTELTGIEVVSLWSTETDQRAARQALAARDGKIIPLVTGRDVESYCILERHTCIDTTAAGGNASLLAATEESH